MIVAYSGLRFCCARPSELKDFQLMEGSIDREYQVLCHGFWSRVACCVSSCSPILERFSQRMHRWSYLFGKLLATTPVGVVTLALGQALNKQLDKQRQKQFQTKTFHISQHLLFSREVEVDNRGSKKLLRTTLHVCSILALYWSVLLTLSSSWSTHKPSPFQRRIVKFESIGIFLRKLRAKRAIWRQNRVSSIGLSKFSVW